MAKCNLKIINMSMLTQHPASPKMQSAAEHTNNHPWPSPMELYCRVQKLRAKRLSSLIVGLAPPRIATRTPGAAAASQGGAEDDDFAEDSQPSQQHAQRQQAHGTGNPQHGGSGGHAQKFTGSKADANSRAPFATLPAAPVGQIPNPAASAAQAAPTADSSAPVPKAQLQAGETPQQGGSNARSGARLLDGQLAAAAVSAAPAAGPEQGVVAEDGLNDGQRTAVRR